MVLMALVYVGIGYFYKDKIKRLLEDETVKIDVAAGIIVALLGIFCWINYRDGSSFYYFDMKPVYYKELIMEQNVKAGDVITMSAGCRHTVIAETELKLIEVQLGEAIDVHDKQKFELEY